MSSRVGLHIVGIAVVLLLGLAFAAWGDVRDDNAVRTGDELSPQASLSPDTATPSPEPVAAPAPAPLTRNNDADSDVEARPESGQPIKALPEVNPYLLPEKHGHRDAAALYDTAVDLMRQRQWGKAVQALLALRLSPHLKTWNYRSMLLIGIAQVRLGRDQEAVTWLARSASVFGSVRGDIYQILGEAYMRLGNYDEARAAFRSLQRWIERTPGATGQAQRAWPMYAKAQLMQVRAYIEKGEAKSALGLSWRFMRDWPVDYGRDAEHPHVADLLWLRAQAYRQLDDAEHEIAVLDKIALYHPECPQYDDAVARLTELTLDRPVVAIGFDDELLRRANRLRAIWRHDAALELIETAESLYPPEHEAYDPVLHAKLAFVKGRTLMGMGRNDEALAIFSALYAKRDLVPEEREDWLAWLAKATGRTNRIAEASQLYDRLATDFPDSSRAESSEFLAAWLLAHDPQQAERADRMLDAFYRDHEKSYWGQKALWFRAWFAYRAGALDKARELFDQLRVKEKSGHIERGCRYWIARIYQRQGRAGIAKSYYLSLAVDDYIGYYRLLAIDRLERMRIPDPDAPLPQQLDQITIDPVSPEPTGILEIDRELDGLARQWDEWLIERDETPAYSTDGFRSGFVAHYKDVYDWAVSHQRSWQRRMFEQLDTLKDAYPSCYRAAGLYNLGLESEAAQALGYCVTTWRKLGRRAPTDDGATLSDRQALFELRKASAEQTDENLPRDLLRQFILLGDLQHAHDVDVYLMDWKTRRQIPWDIRRRLAFPAVFHPAVWRESEASGLDDSIIYAIMRTESRFNPQATSVVNAMGLMQIMPHTGRKISQRLKEPRFIRSNLYQPEVSIRYGSWYLAQLNQKFDGQLPLAIASYNGGPHNVQTWLERNPDLEWDEFIESIEFSQTRDYVKKVLRVAATYRYLYAGRLDVWDFSQPISYRWGDNIDF